MRVIVPHTRIWAQTAGALAAAGVVWQAAQVHGDDGYYRLLEALWIGPDSFIVVEQDIEVRPDTIAELTACPEDWCVATYRYMAQDDYAGLGCTKFSAALIERHPEVIETIGTWRTPQHPTPRHWCPLDTYIQTELRRLGEEQHRHGHVRHLSDGWPSHGCHWKAAA